MPNWCENFMRLEVPNKEETDKIIAVLNSDEDDGLLNYLYPEPKEDYDDYIVDEGTHSLIAMYLIDKGIASTRANVIAEVVRDFFKAVTPLDNYNSKLVSELLPEIFTLGKFYNDVYGDGTYPFHENVKEVKKV